MYRCFVFSVNVSLYDFFYRSTCVSLSTSSFNLYLSVYHSVHYFICTCLCIILYIILYVFVCVSFCTSYYMYFYLYIPLFVSILFVYHSLYACICIYLSVYHSVHHHFICISVQISRRMSSVVVLEIFFSSKKVARERKVKNLKTKNAHVHCFSFDAEVIFMSCKLSRFRANKIFIPFHNVLC